MKTLCIVSFGTSCITLPVSITEFSKCNTAVDLWITNRNFSEYVAESAMRFAKIEVGF